jgi:DNA-binding CsgD family transcriptional regulator
MRSDQLGAVCISALEHMGVGLIACDDSLAMLAATPTATRLLAELRADDGGLPATVRAAAESSLVRGRARWVESGDGRPGLFVVATRVDLAPATVAIRLHPDHMTDVELFEMLRERYSLTARDRRLIGLLRQRRTNAQIAAALALTVGTVKSYVHEVFEKLDVHSRGELLALLDRMASQR